MTSHRPLQRFCDDPEEHGCGRRKAPAPPDFGPGFRYDQVAVMEATEVLTAGAGPYYYYQDDPRNIVQDVLDIFINHGGLVAMDLGYEATIIDLRARLADATDAYDAASVEEDRLTAKLAREFERGYRQGAYWAGECATKVDRFIALGGLGDL